MPNVVVDSSVIVKWLNSEDERYLEQANKLLSDAKSGKIDLIAPILAKYEVGNALLKKNLNPIPAQDTLGIAYELPITFSNETEDLALEAYQMAYQARSEGLSKLTYYDTSYTALAKQEKATLVTDNPKHQAKIKGVEVIPLKDYK